MTLVRPFLIAIFVLLVSATAWAQPSAEALFAEGAELMKARSYAEAALKFEESLRLDARVSTQFMLAQCYEKTERPASAWSLYCDASTAADAQADDITDPARSQARRELAQKARARATPLLQGKLPMIRVDLSPEAARIPGITVKLDQDALPLEGGRAGHINGREHTITAEAAGRKTWSTKYRPTSVCDTPRITIPELTQEAAPRPSPGDETASPLDHGGTLTLGTIGAMSLALGTVTGLRAIALNNEFLQRCPERLCKGGSGENSSIERLLSNRDVEGTMATVSFIAGGTAIAGAIVREIVIRYGQKPQRSSIEITPVLGPTAQGWFLHGKF